MDYDRDGRVDLWVVHYAKWSTSFDRYCGDASKGLRIYCHPKYFEGLASTLYRNRGDGTFEDVTAADRSRETCGRGMSVSFADYDQDGWPDAFVTNDNMPNFLFHNRGDGTFEEVGLPAGVALRDHGKPVASMGTEFKDYDNEAFPTSSSPRLPARRIPSFTISGRGTSPMQRTSRNGRGSMKHSGWGSASSTSITTAGRTCSPPTPT